MRPSHYYWCTGMFAAVHTGPELVPRREWLALMMIHLGPEIAINDVHALVKLFDEVGWRLPDDPFLWPPPEDESAVSKFCTGYLVGAHLHGEWWESADLDDDALIESTEILLVMSALAGKNDEITGACGEVLEPWEAEAWRMRNRRNLPETIATAYRFFAAARAKKPS